jgi:hypothetical protein
MCNLHILYFCYFFNLGGQDFLQSFWANFLKNTCKISQSRLTNICKNLVRFIIHKFVRNFTHKKWENLTNMCIIGKIVFGRIGPRIVSYEYGPRPRKRVWRYRYLCEVRLTRLGYFEGLTNFHIKNWTGNRMHMCRMLLRVLRAWLFLDLDTHERTFDMLFFFAAAKHFWLYCTMIRSSESDRCCRLFYARSETPWSGAGTPFIHRKQYPGHGTLI